MEVTRALNISRFHGYQGTEIDRHSKAFRRAVFENPHVLGHHHYQREGEHILSSVDLAGLQTYTNGYEVADGATVTGEVDRFFATCSRRRNLNLNREGHKNLWLRVNLGRSLPKAGSPGWKSAFIIEPFRLISCYSADECEDIAYRWKVELELGADEQPSRDFDTVLGSQQRSQREIEVDPIKYALPVLKPSRADAWLGRPIGPLGDAHLTDEQRKAIAARRAAN